MTDVKENWIIEGFAERAEVAEGRGGDSGTPDRSYRAESHWLGRDSADANRFGPNSLTETQWDIVRTCDYICDLLVKKNIAYGNSFSEPINVFSKADAFEQLVIWADDKLNRISRGSEFQGDDTLVDLAGYLLLMLTLRGVGKQHG